MAKAKKLPSGNWRVNQYIGKDTDGKRIFKSFTAPSKRDAEFMASEYMILHKQEAENGLTLEHAIDGYISAKSNVLSPSTIRGYTIAKNNAFPLLLDLSLKTIAESDIAQQQFNMNATRYSAKSLSNQYGILTAVMNYYKFTPPKITLKAKEKHAIPVPTKKEIEQIMAIIHQDQSIECQVLLALTCSLRQSEIAALKPSSFNGNLVHVSGARVPNENNQLVFKTSNKTLSSTRKIEMPDFLANLIRQRIDAAPNDDFLFPLTPNIVLSRFKRLLTANNMYPYTIHSLRHAFAALMHSQNIPDLYIMEMGGWSSDYVMKKVYQYTFEEETQAAKKTANSYFDAHLK